MISSQPARTSLPVTDRPVAKRALRYARVVSQFATVQVIVQIIGFATGILLVRLLDQRQYGFFTIANTLQGALNILADIGITIGLVSIGGQVWQDPHRFGQLISTGLRLRRRLAFAAAVVVIPVLYFMLVKNGASIAYAWVLIAAVIAALVVQLSLGVLGVVPRLRADINQIQKIDLLGAIARLVAIAGLALIFLNAGIAVFIGAGALGLQYLLLRRYASGVVDLNAEPDESDRKAMLGFTRSQAANAIFFCVQGQITVFLISFFGRSAGAVAEVGALGRLAMIFTVLANLLMNIFVPAFARAEGRRELGFLYTGIVGSVTGFSLLVFSGAALFPKEFLFVLGNRYSHLHLELLLMVAGAVVHMVASTLWSLNSARAWIKGSWLYVPLTLGTQLALTPFTDFSTVTGVLTFNLISTVPTLLLNIGLSYGGFRSLRGGA